MSSEHLAVLQGSITTVDRDMAYVPIIGAIEPRTVEALALVAGSFGTTGEPADGGVLVSGIVPAEEGDGEGPEGTPLRFTYTEAFNQRPASSLTVLGQPPADAGATLFEGDTLAHFRGSGRRQQSFEDDGVETGTCELDGSVPELGREVPELVEQPPRPTYHADNIEDIPGWMGWQNPDSEDPNHDCDEAFHYALRRPTRLQVAMSAASSVGLGLTVLPGSAVPDTSQQVYYGFSTDGRTAQDVLDETLLGGGSRWWVEDGAIIVDGRALATEGLPIEREAYMLDDESPYAASSMRWVDDPEPDDDPDPDYGAPYEANPDPDPPPDLDDYLARCGPPAPADNIEESPDGTWSYTTRGGFGDDYWEIDHKFTKADGRIVETKETERGWRVVSKTDQAMIRSFSTVRVSTKAYHYDPMCPQALRGTDEITYRYPSMDDVQGAPEGEEPEDAPPWRLPDEQAWFNAIQMISPYLSERRFMRQAWSGEGWLARRMESSRRHTGWHFQIRPHEILEGDWVRTVTPMYASESREENFAPVGDGMWHIHTSDRLSESRVVMANPDPDIEDDIQPSHVKIEQASHSYTVITDQAPPSVSCGQECPDVSDCETLAHERYEYDLEDWRSRQENNRQRTQRRTRRVIDYSFKRFLPDLHVGDMLNGFVIAQVTHTYQDGAPVTTDVTFWGHHPPVGE